MTAPPPWKRPSIRASGFALWLPLFAGVVACGVVFVLSGSGTGDYSIKGAVGGDNAAPAINALIHGHVGGVLARQPFMGLFSILLRAPFAALALMLGGGNQALYAGGAVACVLPAGILALYLLRCGRDLRGSCWAAVAAAILVASPVSLDAIRAGHPEEVLVSVLVTGAVLMAMRGRAIWSGILLGLAIGTKQWAVVAALPVLVALPYHRRRAGLVAAGLAVALAATGPLADPHAFARASDAVGGAHTANAVSGWWPISHPLPAPAASDAASARQLPLGLTRSDALLAVLAFAVAVAALAVLRLRRRGWAVDPLALLALLGLVRCFGDPWDLNYYFLAVLVPLATWETVTLGRAPIVTVLATAAATLTFGVGLGIAPALLDACLSFWIVGLSAYLVRSSFRSSTVTRTRTTLGDLRAHVSSVAADM